jgi:arylamine N-acetyltransferase
MQIVYTPSQVHSYLQRIRHPNADAHISTQIKPNFELLRTVHRHHAKTIAFENLTLVHPSLKGGIPPTDPDGIYKKLVAHSRGGWCFEQNGLLSWMLQSMGYKLFEGAARVVRAGTLKPCPNFAGLVSSDNLGSTHFLTNRSHRIVFVQLEGRTWLCDVGFGGQGLLEPVLLQAYDASEPASSSSSAFSGQTVESTTGHNEHASSTTAAAAGAAISHQAGTSYRLRYGILGSAEHLPASKASTHPEALSHVGFYLQTLIKNTWVDLYYFDLSAATDSDFEAQSFAVSHNHSLFTKQYVVTMPTEEGRLTLVDYQLKVRRAGHPTQVIHLSSDEERDQILQQRFGIDVTARV